LAEIISLPSRFERKVVDVVPFFQWGLQINPADMETNLRLDWSNVNFQGLDVLN
jgi:hypothetical protein